MLSEARRNGAALPVTALVDQFYGEVQKLGGHRWDTSSLLARLEKKMTLTPASSVGEIVAHLQSFRNEANIAGMARFGIDTTTALGITTPQMQAIARQIKRNHGRALALWGTGLRDPRMLAIQTADPKALTLEEMRSWAGDFNSWEIVDTAADLFTETPYWRDLIPEFAGDEREFVRRTAFAMIAGATVHNKDEPDEALLAYLPLIERYATIRAISCARQSTGRCAISASAMPPAIRRRWRSPKARCKRGQDGPMDRQGRRARIDQSEDAGEAGSGAARPACSTSRFRDDARVHRTVRRLRPRWIRTRDPGSCSRAAFRW